VAADFHARFSARARHYRYLLLNHPTRPAVDRGGVGGFHAPLDVDAMRAAAAALCGEHDFSAFRSSECQARSPVRQLTRLAVTARGPWITFDFSANAFLHHMVRNIVGSLVYVGAGRQPAAWLAEILRSRDRGRAAPTFDAAGLYLSGVDYDVPWGLPAHGLQLARTLGPTMAEIDAGLTT
jgi:tRNA pseudouridine38-40 synthase